MSPITLTAQTTKLLDIAAQAGDIILQYFREDLVAERKADNSPVTKADKAANDFLCKSLLKLDNIAIISEENHLQANIQAMKQKRFWLIDPLDGTEAFLRRDNNFCICIARVSKGRPELGLIYLPIFQEAYFTQDNKAFLKDAKGNVKRITTIQMQDKLHMLASKRMKDNEKLAPYMKSKNATEVSFISSAIKFCYIASGRAQLYPHFFHSKYWDAAAGDALVCAAGGRVVDFAGNQLRYDIDMDFNNPYFEVLA